MIDIDALHGAAALPGVEEAAVHQVFYRLFEIGVCPHVGRVLAAKFQAHAEEASRGRAFHGPAGFHRSGEINLLHLPAGNDRGGLAMIEQQVLEQPWRQVGATHGGGKPFAHQQGLRSVFEDDGVAGHQRRDNRVDGGEVGVIPGRDHQYRAQWFTFDQPAKTGDGRGFNRCQGLWGNGDHVPRALFETPQLTCAEAHWPAHLPGQLRDDLVSHGQHRVHRRAAKSRAFAQWPAFPLRLGGAGIRQGLFDLCRIGILALGVNPAIDR